MNTKNLLTILAMLSFGFLNPAKAMASGEYGQYGGQYGGVVAKKISIDKKVKHPDYTTKGGEPVWVDNLFVSDYKFKPNQEIEFKISVTNTGTQDLDNVHFKDTLPQYLQYISGDYDVIFSLKAGETRDFYLKVKVISEDKFSGLYCVINLAEAWFDSEKAQDTAQICVEKKVTQIQALPEAGPAENLAILLGSTILAITGLSLAKKRV